MGEWTVMIRAFICITVGLIAAPLCAEVSLRGSYTVPQSERVSPSWSVHGTFGSDLYVTAGYAKHPVSLVGQSIGSARLLSAGVGYRWKNLFMELAYYWNTTKTDPEIRDEAVWQKLQNDHGVPGWSPEHTVYRLKDGLGARVGLTGRVRGAVAWWVSYRFLSAGEAIDACTGPDPQCKFPVEPGERHWQNRRQMNLGAFELGVGFRL